MAKYDIPKLTAFALKYANAFWVFATKKYAEHGINLGEMPAVIMNARLTATAGRAWVDLNKIDLSCYLMERNPEHFIYDTIPHELCHIIASKWHGSKGHDKAWYATVKFLNVKTERCHNMTTKYRAERK